MDELGELVKQLFLYALIVEEAERLLKLLLPLRHPDTNLIRALLPSCRVATSGEFRRRLTFIIYLHFAHSQRLALL